jgi:hypothetical protein
MTYNPRNKNERSGRERTSTSRAFDELVERRKESRVPCGFRVREGHGGSGI